MRIVIDTNVIISAAINETSTPAMIVDHWRAHSFELVISEALLHEYRRVMNYAHIRRAHTLTEPEVSEFTEVFEDADHFVALDQIESVVVSDPDDDIVVATAIAGNADFIVSGDRHLLELAEHAGIRIIPPAMLLVLLEADL